MALVNSLVLMQYAKKNNFAIPAFNVDNLESVMAVTEALTQLKTPVIIQTIPRTLNYGGIATYPAMIKALMAHTDVDYCLHLDHGQNIETAKNCIQNGFSSVMIDGSSLPFEDNITLTAEVVAYAKEKGISVEGELGAIGGKEEGEIYLESSYTSIAEASEFVEKTNVDTLAIGVGTSHGIYKGIPKINVVRIREISNNIPTPLVLHGATGLDDETIINCINNGISKINYATELRLAFTKSIRASLQADNKIFDPKIYMREAVDEMKKAIIRKIKLLYRHS
ncbi:MAG TPA: class II fructose-bisphosphate aldolase [Clostridia bacterium]|nr:class II fructose-bisphosphate aldolase [Clostridia bacterium]